MSEIKPFLYSGVFFVRKTDLNAAFLPPQTNKDNKRHKLRLFLPPEVTPALKQTGQPNKYIKKAVYLEPVVQFVCPNKHVI